MELSPDDSVLIKGNLAHAYLFDNQFETAKAIYLENKDAKLDEERSFASPPKQRRDDHFQRRND